MKKTPSLKEVKSIKESYEESTSKKFPYVLYTNVIGYYFGKDFDLNRDIYCGCLSEKQALENMLNYINDINDD